MAFGDYNPGQMKELLQNGVSQVASTVQNAVNSGDYSRLSEDVGRELENIFGTIGRTVNGSFQGQGGKGVQQGQYGYRNPANEGSWKNTRTYQQIHNINRERQQQMQNGGRPSYAQPYMSNQARKQSPLYENMENHKILDLLGMVAGYVFGGLLLLTLPVAFLFNAGLGLFVLTIATAALAGGITANRAFNRAHDFEKYVNVLQDRTYIDVDTLATIIGKSAKAIRKDLKRMIRKGWFKQGHLDEGEKTLITSNATYQQYLDTAKAAEERAKVEDGFTEQQREIFRMGEMYISEIRDCNKDIPDEKITAKLDRMEQSVRLIVDRAKQKPSLTQDLRRLMNYYLPTMVKLLHSYIELDAQEKSSSNIEKSKREIENTIDMMNDAFDRLFDDLFDDTSLDISTDAEVMKTLLEQEGLTGHSFSDPFPAPGEEQAQEQPQEQIVLRK